MAAHAGRVAVDVSGAGRGDLAQCRGLAGDDGREVHHLGHAESAVAAQDALHVVGARAARAATRSGSRARTRAPSRTRSAAPARPRPGASEPRRRRPRWPARAGRRRWSSSRGRGPPRRSAPASASRTRCGRERPRSRARACSRRPPRSRSPRSCRRRRTGRPATATSPSSHSRVKTLNTRAPRTTRSAGSSPRATARRCRSGRSNCAKRTPPLSDYGVHPADELGGGPRGEGRAPGEPTHRGRHGRDGRAQLRPPAAGGDPRPHAGARAATTGATRTGGCASARGSPTRA